MFDLQVRAAMAELRHRSELEAIVAKLAALGYRPALLTAREALAKAAHLDASDLSDLDLFYDRRFPRTRSPQPLGGGILFRDGAVYILVPYRSRLFAVEIRDGRTESFLEQFTSDVTSAATATLDGRRLRGMRFEWREEHGGAFHAMNSLISSTTSRVNLLTSPLSSASTRSFAATSATTTITTWGVEEDARNDG